MSKLFSLLLVTVLLIGAVSAAIAHAKPVKHNKSAVTQEANKERLVLMPLRVPEEDLSLQGAMETALVNGLKKRYEVFSGEQVQQKAREIFNKESKKNGAANQDCDETRCMQDIAVAFQAELIATANVIKRADGYFLALGIWNIFDNKVVDSQSIPCENCNAYKVIEKLKELVDAPASISGAEFVASPVTGTDSDSVTWAEAQKGDTIDDYKIYLDTYPKGKYTPFAKVRIKKLQDAAQATAEQQEQQAWDMAQQENSEASFNRYLHGYPGGRFAGFAKNKLNKLNKLKTDLAYKEESDLWQKAAAGNDKTSVENYLDKYPAGRFVAAASAKLKAIKEDEANGPVMVRIPGKNYEIGKYEVTQKEWQAVMDSNPSHFTSCGEDCPVEQVSWNDIQEFLGKLNQKTGRQYRLPTEAEWEYACYGGGQTKYCGGDDINAVAWYKSNSNHTTHPVGQKQVNGYGLYDMSGNVWEWVQDESENSRFQHVLRGGSWSYEPQHVRAAFRFSYGQMRRNVNNGFRLARTIP